MIKNGVVVKLIDSLNYRKVIDSLNIVIFQYNKQSNKLNFSENYKKVLGIEEYIENFDDLYSYIDENNAGQLELLKEAADPEKLSALLQGWLDKTFLSTVLPQRTGNYYTFLNSPELPKLKKLFSKYIANICFKDGINWSYQDWKEEHQTGIDENENEYIHSSRPGSYYPAYLKSIGGKWGGLSLREKLEGKIDNLNFPFIHNSWYNIYQEQVACFLTANGITFKKSGLNNFINIMTPDQINYF